MFRNPFRQPPSPLELIRDKASHAVSGTLEALQQNLQGKTEPLQELKHVGESAAQTVSHGLEAAAQAASQAAEAVVHKAGEALHAVEHAVGSARHGGEPGHEAAPLMTAARSTSGSLPLWSRARGKSKASPAVEAVEAVETADKAGDAAQNAASQPADSAIEASAIEAVPQSPEGASKAPRHFALWSRKRRDKSASAIEADDATVAEIAAPHAASLSETVERPARQSRGSDKKSKRKDKDAIFSAASAAATDVAGAVEAPMDSSARPGKAFHKRFERFEKSVLNASRGASPDASDVEVRIARSSSKWLWIGFGVLAGVALALLLAPATGRRTRALLSDKLGRAGRGAADEDADEDAEADADNDNIIADRVRTTLGEDPATHDLERFNIDSVDGVVTVRGAMADADLQDRIEAVVRGVKGVREVRMTLLTEDAAEDATAFVG